jgi:hypothetical protein
MKYSQSAVNFFTNAISIFYCYSHARGISTSPNFRRTDSPSTFYYFALQSGDETLTHT